ncbi:GxxExxY protein [Luteolibacter flavescens]|uniref:GxxExxY protein n=1 Tax=Luteolibacter flavescens TaxID=1859460 RepID=A0ABT3FKW6_9BACT|nr:GxxExxY protein [Luteolibacter flavescens]MCW1883896.1 GxxExxY protein [Luteolibacter flavescens]
MSELLYKQESYEIMGACFEVYKEMGIGFYEPIYHECLEKEFRWRNLPYVHHPGLALVYKGEPLKQSYEADFVMFSKIVLEVKVAKCLIDEHRAQVINYLRATGFQLGLLVNFGRLGGLEWERIVLTDWIRERSEPPDLN